MISGSLRQLTEQCDALGHDTGTFSDYRGAGSFLKAENT